MDLNLKGKRALVCGASQGIGRATALALANEGAQVTLLARNTEALKELMENLPKECQGGYISCDLAQPEDLANTLQAHLKDHPGFHILVNNAGGPPPGPLLSASLESLKSALDLHLSACHIIAQAVVPGMQQSGYGRIINVISTSVKAPLPGLGVSNSVRGAVANWAKTLATELGPHNITVNNVLPGYTATGRLDQIISNKAQKQGIEPQQVIENMYAEVPLRRFAKPEETASIVTFLASERAGYINGTAIPVDGGRTANL